MYFVRRAPQPSASKSGSHASKTANLAGPTPRRRNAPNSFGSLHPQALFRRRLSRPRDDASPPLPEPPSLLLPGHNELTSSCARSSLTNHLLLRYPHSPGYDEHMQVRQAGSTCRAGGSHAAHPPCSTPARLPWPWRLPTSPLMVVITCVAESRSTDSNMVGSGSWR